MSLRLARIHDSLHNNSRYTNRHGTDMTMDNYADEIELLRQDITSASSFTLSNEASSFSRDVVRWSPRDSTLTQSTGVQDSRSRLAITQHSTTTSRCVQSNSMWYIIALVMPLFSVHNCVMTLRCTPSTVVNTAEMLFYHLNRLCMNAKENLRRLAEDQIARDFFATGMDIVLVIYALGFLILSLYQASVFG